MTQTLNIPSYGSGQVPKCLCGYQLTKEEQVGLEFKGLLQVIEGRDALNVVDVTFVCPQCHAKHLVRFQKP